MPSTGSTTNNTARGLNDSFSSEQGINTGETVQNTTDTGAMTDTGAIIEDSLSGTSDSAPTDSTTPDQSNSRVYGLDAADPTHHQSGQTRLSRLNSFDGETTDKDKSISENARTTIDEHNKALFEGQKYGANIKYA